MGSYLLLSWISINLFVVAHFFFLVAAFLPFFPFVDPLTFFMGGFVMAVPGLSPSSL